MDSAVLEDLSKTDSVGYDYMFRISNKDYIRIQDIRIKNSKGGILVRGANTGDQESDFIEIKRSFFENIYACAIAFTHYSGIANGSNFVTIGGSKTDGNLIHNAGSITDRPKNDPWSVDIRTVNDVIFSYNKVYADGVFGNYASNLIEIGGERNRYNERGLIEHNVLYGTVCEAAIGLKEHGVKNYIIRFNKIYNHLGYLPGNTIPGGYGISVGGYPNGQGAEGVYIYGNEIFNNNYGVTIKRGAHKVYVWSNIIKDCKYNGIDIFADGEIPNDIYIYNNIIANNGEIDIDSNSDRTGIRLAQFETPLEIKNNFFYNNRREATINFTHIKIWDGRVNSNYALEGNSYVNSSNYTDAIIFGNNITNYLEIKEIGYEKEIPSIQKYDNDNIVVIIPVPIKSLPDEIVINQSIVVMSSSYNVELELNQNNDTMRLIEFLAQVRPPINITIN